MILPKAVQVTSFSTKRKDGNVSLRCKVDGQTRDYDIQRSMIIALFEIQSSAHNLLELVKYLPIAAVISVNGLQIEEMQLFSSMDEAEDHVATLVCFSESDGDITTPGPTVIKQEKTSPSRTGQSARKQLSFDTDPSPSPSASEESATEVVVAKESSAVDIAQGTQSSSEKTEGYQSTENEVREEDQVDEEECLNILES